MSDETDVEKLGSLVPEIYFDAIARILPGCIFMIGCLWLLSTAAIVHVPWGATLKGLSLALGTCVALGILGCGYVIGILLTPFGWPLLKFLRRRHCLSRFFFEREPLDPLAQNIDVIPDVVKDWLRVRHTPKSTGQDVKQAEANLGAQHLFMLSHLLHAYVVAHNQQAATLLPKIRAEVSCSRNLTTAFVILFGMSVWLMFAGKVTLLPPLLFAALCVVGGLSAYYRDQSHTERLLSYLCMIGNDTRRLPNTPDGIRRPVDGSPNPSV